MTSSWRRPVASHQILSFIFLKKEQFIKLFTKVAPKSFDIFLKKKEQNIQNKKESLLILVQIKI